MAEETYTDGQGNKTEVPYNESAVATEPVVDPVTDPAISPTAAVPTPAVTEPVEVEPAVPVKVHGSPEAGMQRIRAAIVLLETHSAARIAGSTIGDALRLLDEGYAVLWEHHKPKEEKTEEPVPAE